MTGQFYPASAAQRGLWAAQALLPDSSVFVTAQIITFDTAPDLARLRQATRAALDEADGLRARFHDSPDGLRFILGERLEVEEISTATAVLDAASVADVVDLDTPIDPATGPCARVVLIDHPEHPGVLVIAHHIVLDAYGHMILANRISRLYATPEDPSRLTSITTLTADSDRPGENDADFWADELRSVTGPSTLSGQARGHRIATGVRTRRVEIAAVHTRPQWPMLLTAAIAAFCARSIGTDVVTLGFPMMNRLGSPTANIPTTAVNVIPLQVRVPAASGIETIAATVGDDLRRVTRHARYRGEQIVRDLRARGVDGATGPAVNIKPFGSSIDFDGVTGRVQSLRRGPVVDMSITALHHTDTPDPVLELTIDADADLYDDDQLDRLVADLTAFLSAATGDAQRPVGTIGLPVGAADRAAIAARDASTRAATNPTPLTQRVAAQEPDALAVVCGDDRVTYRGLAQRIEVLATELGPLAAEDIVAVALPRGIDLVAATLAVLHAGGAFLPLDPGFPAQRIADTLADADPVAVIDAGAAGPQITRRRASHGAQSTPSRASAATAEGPAYVIYTSGSTGRPKGVVVGHGALQNFTDAMIRQLDLHREGSMLAVTTASFDISILELLVPLAAGATVVIATAEDVHDPARLAALIRGHHITWMQATPSLWTAVLDAGHGAALADIDVLVGGEQLPASLAGRLAATARSVRNMYGPTETTIWSTTAEIRGEQPVRIGAPIDNTRVRVLDSTLRPVAPGVVGDLYLAGSGLARGYRGRAALTSGVFVADPFGAPGERMYRTGDLVRIDERGALDCLGRADHQVKIRGFRVELGDVEAALESQAEVDHAVAAAVDGRLIGYVTGTAVDIDAVRSALARILPDYMVPAAVVALAEFPLTANGKVDRKALPAPDFAALAGHSRAPQTTQEHALVEVFAEVLGIDQVGADDDFFTLGGDSITAVRVVVGAARKGWEITALDVFDQPTPARLAAVARGVEVSAESVGDTGDTGTTTLLLDDDEIDDLMDGSLL